MTKEEYTQACLRTWTFEGTKAERVSNAMLGIIGELNEYFNAEGSDKIDEAGDVLYYIHILKYELGDSAEMVDADVEVFLSPKAYIISTAMHLAELVKKGLYHGKDVKEDTAATLRKLFYLFVVNNTLDLNEVMQHNVNKLRKRYPNGFKRGEP